MKFEAFYEIFYNELVTIPQFVDWFLVHINSTHFVTNLPIFAYDPQQPCQRIPTLPKATLIICNWSFHDSMSISSYISNSIFMISSIRIWALCFINGNDPHWDDIFLSIIIWILSKCLHFTCNMLAVTIWALADDIIYHIVGVIMLNIVKCT